MVHYYWDIYSKIILLVSKDCPLLRCCLLFRGSHIDSLTIPVIKMLAWCCVLETYLNLYSRTLCGWCCWTEDAQVLSVWRHCQHCKQDGSLEDSVSMVHSTHFQIGTLYNDCFHPHSSQDSHEWLPPLQPSWRSWVATISRGEERGRSRYICIS